MTSIALTPNFLVRRIATSRSVASCGTRGCSCAATTSLATAPNVVTIARTVISAALTVAAVAATSWPLLLAGDDRFRDQGRVAEADAEDADRPPHRMFHNTEGSGVMNAVALVGGIFFLAFVSAFVPVVSIELALVFAAATGTSGTLVLAQVLAAAVGQMVGKSCLFVGGRTAFRHWRRRESRRACGRRARLHRLVALAMRKRAVGAVTVFVSALTGLPPFAVVSALAGGWHIRLPSFFLLGFAGRSARFGSVLMLPHVLAW